MQDAALPCMRRPSHDVCAHSRPLQACSQLLSGTWYHPGYLVEGRAAPGCSAAMLHGCWTRWSGWPLCMWCSVVLCVIARAEARHTCANGECGNCEARRACCCRSQHRQHVPLRQLAKHRAGCWLLCEGAASWEAMRRAVAALDGTSSWLPTLSTTQPAIHAQQQHCVWEFRHLYDTGCLRKFRNAASTRRAAC